MRDFIWTLGNGELPDGSRATPGPVNSQRLVDVWNRKGMLRNAPTLGATPAACLTSPQAYFAHRFGSQGHRGAFVVCERTLN
jgi:hypothetical protein